VAGYGLGRLLSLSDGVFAIALTLLVLSFHVDTSVPGSQVGDVLQDQAAEFYAYGLSVAVISAFWVGHHRLFRWVIRYDNTLLWINILFLGLVALIPYPTDLLGRYNETASAVLYASLISALAFVSAGLLAYAQHNHLVDPQMPLSRWRTLPVAIVFLVSIPIAFWSPRAAQYLWLAVIPVRLVTMRIRERRAGVGPTKESTGPYDAAEADVAG
jgi:uncharacterized membrane protein